MHGTQMIDEVTAFLESSLALRTGELALMDLSMLLVACFGAAGHLAPLTVVHTTIDLRQKAKQL